LHILGFAENDTDNALNASFDDAFSGLSVPQMFMGGLNFLEAPEQFGDPVERYEELLEDLNGFSFISTFKNLDWS